MGVSEMSEASSQILTQLLIDETILQLFELTSGQGSSVPQSPKQVRVEEAILSLFELNFGVENSQASPIPPEDLILSKDGELKEISTRTKTKISALDKRVETGQKNSSVSKTSTKLHTMRKGKTPLNSKSCKT